MMTRALTLFSVLLCLLTGQTDRAIAGAWTLPKGQEQLTVSAGRRVLPVRAWFSQDKDEVVQFNQVFGEYGLRDDLTLGLRAFTQFSFLDDEFEASLGGHLRQRLWTGQDGDVVSVQLGLSFPIERWLGSAFGDDRPFSATEVDLRVLYGRGWQWELGDSFVSGELGLRIRAENLDEQIRFDFTGGHRVHQSLLFLGSLFTSAPLGRRDQLSLKLSPGVVVTTWPFPGRNKKKQWQPFATESVQFNVIWDAAQPNTGMEAVISIWSSF